MTTTITNNTPKIDTPTTQPSQPTAEFSCKNKIRILTTLAITALITTIALTILMFPPVAAAIGAIALIAFLPIAAKVVSLAASSILAAAFSIRASIMRKITLEKDISPQEINENLETYKDNHEKLERSITNDLSRGQKIFIDDVELGVLLDLINKNAAPANQTPSNTNSKRPAAQDIIMYKMLSFCHQGGLSYAVFMLMTNYNNIYIPTQINSNNPNQPNGATININTTNLTVTICQTLKLVKSGDTTATPVKIFSTEAVIDFNGATPTGKIIAKEL